MSLERMVPIECPECKTQQETLIWDSLNAQVSPEAKQELFKANINVFECVSCGFKAIIPVEFMYHDMTLKYVVQYYPVDMMGEDDPALWNSFHPDGTRNMILPVPPHLHEGASYMLRPHVVFDMGELIRYVLFRDRLASFHQG